jgi:FO synthase
MARVLLHGAIDHVQTSWVKLGPTGVRVMLESGADDLGGTLMEETISRMAGSEHGSSKSAADLVEMAAAAGRPARQRTTTYGPVSAERTTVARLAAALQWRPGAVASTTGAQAGLDAAE